ncbi:MAG: hypothetical protein LBU85_11255 [Treponema sp.]|jgi:hypothetical protein|nr:hypothetical protein [Treponema sp.]
MSKKYLFCLLLVLISCNEINLDIYETLYTISNSVQCGFNGLENDDYFLIKVDREKTIEENIEAISILYQNEKYKEEIGTLIPYNLLFENQKGENNLHIYIDFLGDIKFKKIPKIIRRASIRFFPVFNYGNNNCCMLFIECYYSGYFSREKNLFIVVAQKSDVLIMYRKTFDGRNLDFFREDKDKIESILENCFK